MVIRIRYADKDSFFHSVGFMFVVYWAVLVFWQNVGGAELRGTWDTLIKIGLLLYFVCYYLKRTRIIGHKVTWILLLTVCLLLTAIREEKFPLSNVIAYVYPIVFLLMVYGFGDRFEITRDHLIAFCNCIIVITLYAAIYALIFHWDQFTGAFSIDGAYGNELSSFFVSNFEYGMYLVAAITSCIICLKYSANNGQKRIFYLCVLIIFASNLILTFSRTSIFSIGVLIAVFFMLGSKKTKRWLATGIIGGLILFAVPEIRRFAYEIVLKENQLSGRDILMREALKLFNDGTPLEKLFGFGIYDTRELFRQEHNHSSVHNAYLQVLICHGVVNLAFMVTFLLVQLRVAVSFIKKDCFLGVLFLGMLLIAITMMTTTTAQIFSSPIDSYFLTMFFIVVPKYVRNSVTSGSFEHIESEGWN